MKKTGYRITPARFLGLAAAGALMLSSCGILPEEETFPAAPTISAYESVVYKTSEVLRRDLSLEQSISAKYVPVQTKELSFPVAGLSYSGVYVEVGDEVKEGQLLAELDMEDLGSQINAVTQQMETLNLQAAQNEEEREVALRRQAILDQWLTEEEKQASAASVNERFDKVRRDIDDKLYIADLKLKDYEEKILERQIYAPFDGTVTYTYSFNASDVSAAYKKVVSVADSSMSLFRGETDIWERLEEGMPVTVTVSSKKVTYAAKVISETTLGLPEIERVPGKKAYVYFALDEPGLDLEDNDRGNVNVVLDTRENVLSVPCRAVTEINGQDVVYYPDDIGMRVYKEIEAGLSDGTYTEILSGVSEGDIVIVN